jgi:putative ABC transport system permease protein
LEVIGVLKSQGLFGGDDQAVFVPLPLLIRIHGLSRYGGKGDANLLVKAKNAAVLPIGELERRVRIVLRQVRHLPPKAEDNFAINRQDALLDQVKSIVGYVQIVGLFIAAFSLLVGATGVANILYVSVRERQGEIGIQRAMGAPRAFVLGLFIVEGSYLALIGGGVGVLLTGLLMMGAKPFLAQEGLVLGWSLGQVGKVVLLALGVGFIAALAPAYRAARLQPIEAIRGA